MTRRSRKAMPIAQHWRWRESWWPISWQSTVVSAIFKCWRRATAPLRRCGGEYGGFLRRVACQVLPSSRLGEGAQAPDAPVDKFRDWQENTNSIFCSRPLAGLRQQMEVWFYLKEEPRLRSQHTRRRTRKNLHPRSSEARRESLCPLDKDLSWKSDNRKLEKSTSPVSALTRI